MNMMEILKGELKEGMEIIKEKELNNKFKYTLTYAGMTGEGELVKTCTPSMEKQVCRKSIDEVITGMYFSMNDYANAKYWLNGMAWKEAILTYEEVELIAETIQEEKIEYIAKYNELCKETDCFEQELINIFNKQKYKGAINEFQNAQDKLDELLSQMKLNNNKTVNMKSEFRINKNLKDRALEENNKAEYDKCLDYEKFLTVIIEALEKRECKKTTL